MNILQKTKLLFSNNLDDYIKKFLRGDDIDDPATGMDKNVAMHYSGIFACSRVLSETLASLPIFVYTKDTDGNRKVESESTLADVLRYEPNTEMTPFNFKEALMMNLCLGGNGFAQKLYNAKGDILGLIPIDYESVVITRNSETKKLVYKIVDKSGGKEYTRKDIFHIPGISLDGITGLIPISYASKAINLGLTYETFGENFYKNGANTNIIIYGKKAMSDVAFDRFKKQVTDHTGLKKVNKPWLMEEGTEVKELSIKPVDAELLQSKYFSIEEICRFYRVPQHLVQLLNKSTNNNIEHQGLEFVVYTMLPWAKRWEENINLQLLTKEQRKKGMYVEFKFDALLRGDVKSRAEAYASGRNWGWLSANDIRRLENMDTIPNGDIYLTPSNMYEAGKEPSAAQVSNNKKILADEIYKLIQGR